MAESDLEKERALKWFMILPLALLRETKSGGKGGRGLIAARFNCLSNGDWGTLLTFLKNDLDRKNELGGSKRKRKEDNLELKKRNALKLLGKGMISKAVS